MKIGKIANHSYPTGVQAAFVTKTSHGLTKVQPLTERVTADGTVELVNNGSQVEVKHDQFVK